MNNQMSAPQDEQPGLDESDILPLQQEDRSADNPMGTVMNFLGLAVMADLTVSTLETVGAMDGGLDMTAITPVVVIEPMPDLDFGIESPMGGIGAPSISTPSFTA
ncbi:MAG: hypothetical protein COB36_01470 [Alphaproteobacteria bacterium]|nr:MAG: hypothetical protein COB36_01470 [Alphaproteobacteria bacterium]